MGGEAGESSEYSPPAAVRPPYVSGLNWPCAVSAFTLPSMKGAFRDTKVDVSKGRGQTPD